MGDVVQMEPYRAKRRIEARYGHGRVTAGPCEFCIPGEPCAVHGVLNLSGRPVGGGAKLSRAAVDRAFARLARRERRDDRMLKSGRVGPVRSRPSSA